MSSFGTVVAQPSSAFATSALFLAQPSSVIMDQMKRTGKCKWFNSQKGYGFITPDQCFGTGDVFVHQSVIKAQGFRSLCEGEPVEYYLDLSEATKSKARRVTGPNGADVKGQPNAAFPSNFAQGPNANDLQLVLQFQNAMAQQQQQQQQQYLTHQGFSWSRQPGVLPVPPTHQQQAPQALPHLPSFPNVLLPQVLPQYQPQPTQQLAQIGHINSFTGLEIFPQVHPQHTQLQNMHHLNQQQQQQLNFFGMQQPQQQQQQQQQSFQPPLLQQQPSMYVPQNFDSVHKIQQLTQLHQLAQQQFQSETVQQEIQNNEQRLASLHSQGPNTTLSPSLFGVAQSYQRSQRQSNTSKLLETSFDITQVEEPEDEDEIESVKQVNPAHDSKQPTMHSRNNSTEF